MSRAASIGVSVKLTISDTSKKNIERTVGPFAAPIRPFCINGDQSLVFVNVNNLLGFEVGDLRTGKKLYQVEVKGYQKGEVKRHGCPAHGIALTHDEKELWLADCANSAIHIFDATGTQIGAIAPTAATPNLSDPQTLALDSFGNLYVAGRCASMTHGAQSAARVTGPCFAMGEAAGVAAGMALSAGVAGDAIDVPALQAKPWVTRACGNRARSRA